MKKSLMLSVLATGLITVTAKAHLIGSEMMIASNTMNKNAPLITDGAVDLEQYLFGAIDSNGQTILHRIAANCDNDDFTLKLKLFDVLENHIPHNKEKIKSKLDAYQLLAALSQDAAAVVMVSEALMYLNHKDNNGDTALDLAKKRNALNPHKRCTQCVDILEFFDKKEVGQIIQEIINKAK